MKAWPVDHVSIPCLAGIICYLYHSDQVGLSRRSHESNMWTVRTEHFNSSMWTVRTIQHMPRRTQNTQQVLNVETTKWKLCVIISWWFCHGKLTLHAHWCSDNVVTKSDQIKVHAICNHDCDIIFWQSAVKHYMESSQHWPSPPPTSLSPAGWSYRYIYFFFFQIFKNGFQ